MQFISKPLTPEQIKIYKKIEEGGENRCELTYEECKICPTFENFGGQSLCQYCNKYSKSRIETIKRIFFEDMLLREQQELGL